MADTGLSLLEKQPFVTLKDGTTHELKLGFLAWAHLEQLYGSFDAALLAGVTIGAGGTVLQTLLHFLWAGLLHERIDENLKPIGKQWTIGEVEALLTPGKRVEYMRAIEAAVQEAQFEEDPQ